MESLKIIDAKDGNKIYGIYRSENNKKLVIHIHGLTAPVDGYVEGVSAGFFLDHKFDHYRVGLYHIGPGSRRLDQSGINTHIIDTEQIYEHFYQEYDEIYVTSHSLGSLVTLIQNPSNEKVKAVSLVR